MIWFEKIELRKGKKLCTEFLQNYELFAEKLAKVQDYYRFDGWLINIENALSTEEVTKMIEFLKVLKGRKMK